MALHGNIAVVAAIKHDPGGVVDAGSAYVFQRQDNGTPHVPNDDTWIEAIKLTARDLAANDQFGRGVDVEGDTIVIGAWNGDNEVAEAGSVYVYQRQADGSWHELGEVIAGDANNRNFGSPPVELQGSLLIVADPRRGRNPTKERRVFVFGKTTNITANPDAEQKPQSRNRRAKRSA